MPITYIPTVCLHLLTSKVKLCNHNTLTSKNCNNHRRIEYGETCIDIFKDCDSLFNNCNLIFECFELSWKLK